MVFEILCFDELERRNKEAGIKQPLITSGSRKLDALLGAVVVNEVGEHAGFRLAPGLYEICGEPGAGKTQLT